MTSTTGGDATSSAASAPETRGRAGTKCTSGEPCPPPGLAAAVCFVVFRWVSHLRMTFVDSLVSLFVHVLFRVASIVAKT